ncbi:hypothetical protein K503DRAFT_787303 [Rhizopogon vinicolor AM-OR11-026]|uniref:Uncharacterized protein n=1 Tax=Rhizopogon vinicolor AM-OR11-026 TaxID=1314800 RepID=A0A1B7MI52_9AGAM|nr:hypothetical protein K503DRAFT_787303 [Rhizopogon vinicolor AM-OR11-026]
MIVSDKNVKLVMFTSNILEQCKRPIPKHAVYLSDIENPEGGRKVKWSCQQFCNSPVMDEETENWPIAMKHGDEFDLVKLNYELRLHRGNSLVGPADVNEALTGECSSSSGTSQVPNTSIKYCPKSRQSLKCFSAVKPNRYI